MRRTPESPIRPELEVCVQRCTDCHRACLVIAATCLQEGGPHAEPPHVRLLWDAAELCRISADFMLRGSGAYQKLCAL